MGHRGLHQKWTPAKLVDLNPHQIEAALFAFKSPLSRGAMLADEVGLGKTIEAGLVLSQKWAERKRKVLIITPSNLRKQWHTLPGSLEHPILESEINARREVIQQAISRRNAAIFEAEAEKLDGWADDLKVGLEQEIKELDRQIKEARRTATAALTLEDKLAGQKQVKALEQQRNAKRRALFDAQDAIDRQRERLIAEIEGKLQQRTSLKELFKVRWKLV